MKTAIYLNTFAKMQNYDLNHLQGFKQKNIAIVSDEDYPKFQKNYNDFFDEIHVCQNESSDPFEKISYTLAREVIANLVSTGEMVRIICLSEDNLLIAAKLREEFDIPGMKFNQTLSFRDKVIMKGVLSKHGIRVPRYSHYSPPKNNEQYFEALKLDLGLPFVLKPTTLLGGLGVVIVRGLNDFIQFAQQCGDDIVYEAEEFIAGTLFHCDTIRKNDVSIFSVVCEYTNPNVDFQSGKSVISIILTNDNPVVQKIKTFNESVLNALGLKEGISHHEIFVKENGELVFLEIAARSPGAVITPMYRRAFEIGLEDIDYKMQMEIPFELSPQDKGIFLSGIFPIMSGRVSKLLNPNLVSPFEITWAVKEGDVLGDSKSLRDKACAIVAWNKNAEQIRLDFDLLKTFQCLEVD